MSGGAVLLAFDTSTSVGSVAVARGGEIPGRAFLERAGEHAARLVPAVDRVLEEAGVTPGELEGIVVGKGPGSFTGVRVAAATARGLARALGVPVWPVSSLAGAAASGGARIPRRLAVQPGSHPVELPEEAGAWPRYVLFDARGDRVYAGCYRFLPDRMEVLVAPGAATIPEVLDSAVPGNALFCGDGALRHAPALEEAGYIVLPFPAGLPTAEGMLRVRGIDSDQEPMTRQSRWEPEYLRGSSARRGSPGRTPSG